MAFANDVNQDIPTGWAAFERRSYLATREANKAQEEELTEEENTLIAKLMMKSLRQQAEECKLMKERLVREKELLARAEGDAEAWEAKVSEVIQEHGNLRLIEIADDLLILEQLPVRITIATFPETEVPRAVRIEVRAHPRPVKPEHVKVLYEKSLTAAGIGPDETEMNHSDMSFVRMNPSSPLEIVIGPSMWASDGSYKPYCPHPWLVQEFYRMLLGTPSKGGFASHLTSRQRGTAPKADNHIPACVAFYLQLYMRAYGEKHDRPRIHKLLNTHVLYEIRKSLPEEEYSSSEVNQLWSNVKKVAAPLVRISSRLLEKR